MGSAEAPRRKRVDRAREKLAIRYLQDRNVRLVDVGSEPWEQGERAVLRVHVHDSASPSRLELPEGVDGIPVRVVVGDSRPAR
jgi:hypothetical protein